MARSTALQLNQGFTLVELLVVLTMFVIVFALSNVSLSGLIANNSTQEFAETFVSDVNRQQNQAMTGEAASGSATAYGIKFDTTAYTLFSGSTYMPAKSGNVVVDLPKDLRFEAISFPQQQVIFAEDSGEVEGYVATSSSVMVRNTTTNTTQTFQVNKLGVLSY